MYNRGCAIQPTQRSENARLKSNAFDGECKEQHRRKASIIRMFPKIAMIEKIMFSTKITV